MIRVAVLYPSGEGRSFDVDYYKNNHMKLVWEKLGPLGLAGAEVDAGIGGMGGDAPAPYAAIGYLLYETLEEFQSAMAQAGDELFADVPNYTNIEPVVQISDYTRINS